MRRIFQFVAAFSSSLLVLLYLYSPPLYTLYPPSHPPSPPLYTLHPPPGQSHQQLILEQFPVGLRNTSAAPSKGGEGWEHGAGLKRILYWNDFYGSRNFGFCCGRHPYRKYDCRTDSCYTSKDRGEQLSTFDAIVFHERSLDKDDLPEQRFPHQYYIFLSLESAAFPSHLHFQDWEKFFNLTMTFREDSDIVMPYGRVVRREEEGGEEEEERGEGGEWEEEGRWTTVRGKTRLAAWFVSRCKTRSKREDLVQELVKHLPTNSLDVYGVCGNLTCPRPGQSRSDCWAEVSRTHKFYLSLENSICRDYVTEKLFSALQSEVVPVVLGGADYSSLLPPYSYIDMQDFPSLHHLALYLVRLDREEEEYSKYLKWKNTYRVLNSRSEHAQAHCSLCSLLHSLDGEKRLVEDLHQWWVTGSNCHEYRPANKEGHP